MLLATEIVSLPTCFNFPSHYGTMATSTVVANCCLEMVASEAERGAKKITIVLDAAGSLASTALAFQRIS